MSIALAFPAAAAGPSVAHLRRNLKQSSPENLSASCTPTMMLKSSLSVRLSLSITHNRANLQRSIASTERTSRTAMRCNVALNSTASVDTDQSASSSTGTESDAAGAEEKAKIGARVRVNVPLKVYHVVRVPEVDLLGMEGVIKDYVAVWKGKQISANLPYKVQFFKEIEGRGKVKFFAHLKEDEFEFIE